jgi:hypothetical protein
MLDVLVLVRQRPANLGQLAGEAVAKMTISRVMQQSGSGDRPNSIRGLRKNPSVDSRVTTCSREFIFRSEILFGLQITAVRSCTPEFYVFNWLS